jgi:CheY-like chemotaxis protein
MAKTLTKVLVVDDEAAILEMIRFALEQAGLVAQTAANAYME